MARHAFISHSHKDSDASAEILAALEQRGVKCWTAPRDVPPGGSYAEAILTAIENASCFVLVYTEHANVSPHVLREVERALSLGINIMPVRFDSSNISKSLDYLLATVHWLSVVTEPRNSSVHEAAERIAACVLDQGDAPPVLRNVPPPALPATTAPPAPTPPPTGKGTLLLGIGLAVLAIAGVLFAVQTVRRSLPKETVVATPTPIATLSATPMAAQTELPTITPAPTDAPKVVEASIPPMPVPPQPPPVSEETPDRTAETESEQETIPSPPPPQRISRATPLEVAKQYYSYLADKNTIKAYELLSTAYRSRENFVTYTRSFASTESLRLVSAHETSTRGNVATITVTFDKKNQKFGWIRWQGPVQLTFESSGWRIDSLKGLKPSSLRR